jgi:threonine dehydratase
VAAVLTVDDSALMCTMLNLGECLKVVVEPTADLGAAALLEGAIDAHGQRLGIVSGGNAEFDDLARFARAGA